MKLKKIVSLLTSASLAFTFAASTMANASEYTGNVVYVEGHAFKVYTSFEGDTIVESLENETRLVMDEEGNADIVLENKNGTIDNFDAEINDLSEDNVDIVITQLGDIVDEITSYDDLVEDSYEGQVAVAGVTITLGMVLEALAIAAITIVVAGVTCYAVSAIQDQIKKNKYLNFYAYLNWSHTDIFINPTSISDQTAIDHLRVTGDSGGVYTYFKNNAAYLAYNAGYGVDWCGPENHYKWWVPGCFYDHYHDTASGAHVWYGFPQSRSLSR